MPSRGFEPRRLSALPPQDSVSTSFTTRAWRRIKYPGRGVESRRNGADRALRQGGAGIAGHPEGRQSPSGPGRPVRYPPGRRLGVSGLPEVDPDPHLQEPLLVVVLLTRVIVGLDVVLRLGKEGDVPRDREVEPEPDRHPEPGVVEDPVHRLDPVETEPEAPLEEEAALHRVPHPDEVHRVQLLIRERLLVGPDVPFEAEQEARRGAPPGGKLERGGLEGPRPLLPVEPVPLLTIPRPDDEPGAPVMAGTFVLYRLETTSLRVEGGGERRDDKKQREESSSGSHLELLVRLALLGARLELQALGQRPAVS